MDAYVREQKKVLSKLYDRKQNYFIVAIVSVIFTIIIAVVIATACSYTHPYKVLGKYKPRNTSTVIYTEYDRQKLDNPNPFNENCYIDQTGDRVYNRGDATSAMFYFYEETGLQSYYVYVDLTDSGVTTDAEADAYAMSVVKSLIDDPYAVIHYESNSIPVDDSYVSVYNQWLFGEATTPVLDAKGRNIITGNSNTWIWCDYSTTNEYMVTAECVVDTLMNYHETEVHEHYRWDILICVILILWFITAIMFIAANKSVNKKIKSIMESLEKQAVLNTDLDDLVDAYVKVEKNKR